MGRFGDRLDGTSSQRLLGWTSDVAAGMTSNLRYLTRLHDPLQVCFQSLRIFLHELSQPTSIFSQFLVVVIAVSTTKAS